MGEYVTDSYVLKDYPLERFFPREYLLKKYDRMPESPFGIEQERLGVYSMDDRKNVKTRVCIVRQHYYPYQRNLRRNAEALASQGYEVDVICQRRDGQKSHETTNGVNVYRLPLAHRRGKALTYFFGYTTFFLMVLFILGWRTLRKSYRVVEVETMPDFLVFATLIPRLFGTKIILYMFENIPSLFASTFNTGPRHVGVRLLTFISKLSAKYAHHVIVSDGEHHKQWVKGLGIPDKKITLIYNVPDEKILIAPETSLPVQKDSFRLLVLSSFLPRYGVETVVRALPRLLKDIPNLHVDLLGEGESRPGLETLAKRLEVDKYINFAGWRPQEELTSYIAASDIALAPMIADVGLANKIFDYFSMGKPCVASALPSLQLAFNDNYVSFFAPGNDEELADRILELYRDPQKRAMLGAQGYAFYQQRRWSVMKSEYLAVYKNIYRGSVKVLNR